MHIAPSHRSVPMTNNETSKWGRCRLESIRRHNIKHHHEHSIDINHRQHFLPSTRCSYAWCGLFHEINGQTKPRWCRVSLVLFSSFCCCFLQASHTVRRLFCFYCSIGNVVVIISTTSMWLFWWVSESSFFFSAVGYESRNSFIYPRSNEAKDKRGEILGFVISFRDSDNVVSSHIYFSTLHVPQVEKNWNAFCCSSMLIPPFFFYSFLGFALGCINGTPLFHLYTKPKLMFTGRL
jgi:hypothetical protein